MKNVFISCFILLSICALAQAKLEPTKVPVATKEKVIASVVTANKHLYVFTGLNDDSNDKYKVKGKVTLFHFDENNKLILKKPIAVPMIGNSKIMIDAAFEIGTQIVVIGTVDDKKNNRTSGYFTVDPIKLTPSKKIIPIFDSKFEENFGTGNSPNKFEYSQVNPGRSLGIYVSYSTPLTRTSLNDPGRAYHSRYFIIDEAAVLHDVLKYDDETEDEDRTHESFLMGEDNQLYIFTNVTPHIDYDWEVHEMTAASERRLKNDASKMWLDIFNPANREKQYVNIKFSDTTLFTGYSQLIRSVDGIYLTGTCNNGISNYKRILNDDTSGIELRTYFFSQKIEAGENLIVISASSYSLFSEELMDMLKDSSLSEEDRDIGNDDIPLFIGCHRKSNGNILLTYALYVRWNWPPYAEIKNDKRYTFEKNEEGDIISSSGPGGDGKSEYKSLVTYEYNPTTKQITGKAQPMKLTLTHTFFHQEALIAFYGRGTEDNYTTFYVANAGVPYSWLVASNSAGNKEFFNANEKLEFAPGIEQTLRFRIAVVNGKGEFTILQVPE